MAIDWDAKVLAPSMGVFGERVTYRPANAPAFDILDAVYDDAFVVVTLAADGSEVNSTTPALGVRLSLFQVAGVRFEPAQNDRVEVWSVMKSFRVVDVQPDSHGHAMLTMNRVGTLGR